MFRDNQQTAIAFQDLPTDIKLLILSYLDLRDLANVSLTSKQFNLLTQNIVQSVVQREFLKKYPELSALLDTTQINWVVEFRKAKKREDVLNEFLSFRKSLMEVANKMDVNLFSNNLKRTLRATSLLKSVLFENDDMQRLNEFAQELRPDTQLGKLYTQLKELDLLNNTAQYYVNLGAASPVTKKRKLSNVLSLK